MRLANWLACATLDEQLSNSFFLHRRSDESSAIDGVWSVDEEPLLLVVDEGLDDVGVEENLERENGICTLKLKNKNKIIQRTTANIYAPQQLQNN